MAESKQQGTDHGKRLSSWTFPEFPEHKRGLWWYIVTSVIVVGIMIYALSDKNYLFAVIIALAAFIYIILIQRKPRLITFTITEDGLEVHEAFYPFKDIKKFWVIYDPPDVKALYFEFESKLRPILTIPLETQNPLVVRDILLKYLKEDLERDNEFTSDALQRELKL